MKNKSIKFAKGLLDVFLALVIIVSLAAFCLSVYCHFNYNAEYAKYLYVLVGVFLFPIEYFATKNVTGVIVRQTNMLLCAGLTFAILVFAIISFVLSCKMYNKSISSKKRKKYGIVECFFIFIILSYLIVSAVVLTANYSIIENSLDSASPELITQLKRSIGVNAIALKEIIVAYVGIFVLLFSFIVFIIGMSHKTTKTKIYSSLNFYSDEYEQKENVKQVTKQQKAEISADIPENNQDAKNLIKKIMQLEELKNQGKISTVDYTRLRQKAIRRYKK